MGWEAVASMLIAQVDVLMIHVKRHLAVRQQGIDSSSLSVCGSPIANLGKLR